jgi:hypothetical protein
MKHFNDSLWADFVRGVVNHDTRREMEAHLESGCATCQSAKQWLQRVEGVAALDRKHAIPNRWIARAREVFPLNGTNNTWIEDLVATIGELVFETRFDAQPSGIRSLPTTATGGRMVFRAGDYRIHVSVESPTVGEPGEIVGQISNDLDPPESLEGIVVQAIAGGRMLSETTANRFGEFVIEYLFLEQATLRLASRERGLRIEVPLYPETRNAVLEE